MNIKEIDNSQKEIWNTFVRTHYPAIGAFMQTWGWGEFQRMLGRTIGRYAIEEQGEMIAVFTLVQHKLPFGLVYGYTPRGPVIARGKENKIEAMFEQIRLWTKESFPHFLFIRLEPPIESFSSRSSYFYVPSHYIQPRHNTAVLLDNGSDDFLSRFHSSTRSNIKHAEKNGVTAELKTILTADNRRAFTEMMEETSRRNNARNIYPDKKYFDALFTQVPPISTPYDPKILSLGIFQGYHNGELVAINIVLFFEKTATYLYGASYKKHLSSKITTYLHFYAMQQAQKFGCTYYDLGGIDEIRWPTLTTFKRQFHGEEFHYVGNVIIPIRPSAYRIYNIIRTLLSRRVK